MSSIIEEFEYRKSLLENLNFDEAGSRLVGFYNWLLSVPEISKILHDLSNQVDIGTLIKECNYNTPPKVSTPDEVAALGFFFMEQIKEGTEPFEVAEEYGIRSIHDSGNIQSQYEELITKFIEPASDYITRSLEDDQDKDSILKLNLPFSLETPYPLEITESLRSFEKEYPIYDRNAFIMMQFGTTPAHKKIIKSIKDTLKKYDINALRADDKEYHDDLFSNVLTYIHGCKFGIAVFERLEVDDFNPNVSLEVGYIRGLRKSICLLKDKTLKTMQTDLIGKLYKEFDPQDPENTIPSVLEKWLRDKEIITL